LTSLPTTLCIADFMCEVKGSSSKWIKSKNLFDHFPGWQDGYAAFTVSYSEKDRVIAYIKNQEEHHREVSYREELQSLLRQAGIDFIEKYLE
jgi:putative transposase